MKVTETKPVSEKLTAWFLRTGYDQEQIPATQAEAVALQKKIFVEQRKNKALPPTKLQLDCLEGYGYNRVAMSQRTKGYCSTLIYKLKKGIAVAA